MQLDYNELSQLIDLALNEDIGRGDITSLSTVDTSKQAQFSIIAKEPLVLCGIDVVYETLSKYNLSTEYTNHYKDGDLIEEGSIIASGQGNAQLILSAERVMLNFLQFLSGIATMTKRYTNELKGTKTKLLDTRKTLPGLRALCKYAFVTGGGYNHRFNLSDGVLIKDNHIALSKNLKETIQNARRETPALTRVEVECETLDQVQEALDAPADMVLLDNMNLDTIRQAVDLVNKKIPLEVSGGIGLKNIREIAETGVDYISVGRITRAPHSVDISMDITPID